MSDRLDVAYRVIGQFAVDLSIQNTNLLNARKQLDKVVADANASDLENARVLKEAEDRLRGFEVALEHAQKPKPAASLNNHGVDYTPPGKLFPKDDADHGKAKRKR